MANFICCGFLFTLLTILVSTSGATPKAKIPLECPNFFMRYDVDCYFFSEVTLVTLNWADARSYCQSYTNVLGTYDLAPILDDNQYEFIANISRNNAYQEAYVGAYNSGVDSLIWNWTTGENISLSNPLWYSYSPDYRYSESLLCGVLQPMYENLGTITSVRRLPLTDTNCAYPNFFICRGTPV